MDDIDTAADRSLEYLVILLTQAQFRLGQPLDQFVVEQQKQLTLGHGIDGLLFVLLISSGIHVQTPIPFSNDYW